MASEYSLADYLKLGEVVLSKNPMIFAHIISKVSVLCPRLYSTDYGLRSPDTRALGRWRRCHSLKIYIALVQTYVTARYYIALRIRLLIDIWLNQSTCSKIGALQVP